MKANRPRKPPQAGPCFPCQQVIGLPRSSCEAVGGPLHLSQGQLVFLLVLLTCLCGLVSLSKPGSPQPALSGPRKLGGDVGHVAARGSLRQDDRRTLRNGDASNTANLVVSAPNLQEDDSDGQRDAQVDRSSVEHPPQPRIDERQQEEEIPVPTGLYALSATDIDGHEVQMSSFAGHVLLVVNVASACGYTESNYRGLQALYEKYGPYGLEILAFPCNQFGGQEPGGESHIKSFVQSRFGVTFRMMGKVNVNGPAAHPIFKYLKRHLPLDQGGGGGVSGGNDLVWNFNKFLVDKRGRPVGFYYQNFDAERLESDVYTFLTAQ